MEQKKSQIILENLAEQMTFLKTMSRDGVVRSHAPVGAFTAGRDEFNDLKSEDLNRRPSYNPGLDLQVGKKRRSRYSKHVLGKK